MPKLRNGSKRTIRTRVSQYYSKSGILPLSYGAPNIVTKCVASWMEIGPGRIIFRQGCGRCLSKVAWTTERGDDGGG